ncbi:BNR-4 repeat-containing protein [Dyadobacter sp. CY323]|uniref:BNR-4 repeat-containing protein n=1 Tax=Dyadobacter sp. CY323 TaxID=2907302 RepID=UPI001F2FF668|nr:BNR-4 repeat-containing protein [Dyadobacter sp. CY323]MCE6988035.1 BNR repeat-containing protein [Dyadobacter sp. CY323]
MRILILTLLFFSFNLPVFAQNAATLTDDGAWCWFSDPRAIYTKDGTVVTGWVTKSGDIIAASLNPENGKTLQKRLYTKLEIDDHDNPAFLELPDQRILTQYTWHGGSKNGMGVIQNTTLKAKDVSSFSDSIVFKPQTAELLEKFKRETYTYANPFMLSAENDKIYSFGRWVGFKPNFITSTDDGKTWSDPRVIITSKKLDTNNRPYVKYFSDGKSKIHLIFTDGHPNAEPLNSVYYCYYEKDAFWRADGSKIADIDQLPFNPGDASVIYKATPETGKAWIFDVVVNKKGQPVVAYTRYPNNEKHHYYYAVFDGKKWNDHYIIDSGKWFPQTPEGKKEREENYSGGLTIDPLDPSIVYFSHEINNVFEISRAETRDFGKNWKISPITRNSTLDNIRPVIPRYKKKGDKNVLLWMQNKKYVHYTDYDTGILWQIIKP